MIAGPGRQLSPCFAPRHPALSAVRGRTVSRTTFSCGSRGKALAGSRRPSPPGPDGASRVGWFWAAVGNAPWPARGQVIILGPAIAGMKNRPHFDPAHWPLAIASRSAGDETHLVMGDNVSRHRVCLRGLPAGHPIAWLIPCDALLDARLQALAALDRWLRGARRGAQMFGPTAYQARRLDLLLAILDLRRGGGVTSHMVARRLVYPRLSIEPAWPRVSFYMPDLHFRSERRRPDAFLGCRGADE